MIKHSWHPLPPFLKVRDSKIHGQGLFTKKALYKGHDLGLSHLQVHPVHRLHNNLLRSPLGGYINHSCKPNCKLETKYQIVDILDTYGKIVYIEQISYHLVTIVNVKRGEELTLDYAENVCGVDEGTCKDVKF
jgi:hypothetical protein